jgi:polyvinyl alcohol dehydrogenase (cytochrome)
MFKLTRVLRIRRYKLLGAAAFAAAFGMASSPVGAAGAPAQPDWTSSGQNNFNTRHAALEHTIGTDNVGGLKPKWVFTTAGNVSATATVVHGVAYVPDWSGMLWAIDTKTGKAIWSHAIGGYTGTKVSGSRTSPAYANGVLVIGTGNLMTAEVSPAFEIAINAETGEMLWRTQMDDDTAAIMTGSPTIDDGVVYTGVSSKTEHIDIAPAFRGSVEALDLKTGKILWKTYMVPEGFNGAAVWSSQPVVDHKTGMLYVTTGNSYSVPVGYCVNPGDVNCTALPPDAYVDSIVALSMKTGKVVWAHRTLNADTWTMSKPNSSPDFDFGDGAHLFTTTINGKMTDVVAAGQKSGMYYALEPATGELIWATQAGPGGVLGGIEWGSTMDGKRIYASISNGSHKSYTYTTYDKQKKITTGGLFVALDSSTGKILWQTAAPEDPKYITDGFVSSANGVVYAGSSGGNFYAIDAKTGEVKWSFPSGGAVWSGAAIVDGVVYWGSGYDTQERKLPYNGNNNKFYAFSLDGHRRRYKSRD